MCNNATAYNVCSFNIYDICGIKIVAKTGRKIRDPLNNKGVGRFGIMGGGGFELAGNQLRSSLFPPPPPVPLQKNTIYLLW